MQHTEHRTIVPHDAEPRLLDEFVRFSIPVAADSSSMAVGKPVLESPNEASTASTVLEQQDLAHRSTDPAHLT